MISFERFVQVTFLFYSARDTCVRSEMKLPSAEYNTNSILYNTNIYEYEYNTNFTSIRKMYHYFSMLTTLCLL